MRSALPARVFWILWTAGLASWVTGLVFLSGYDLALSASVLDESSVFGQAVAVGGEWPAWAVVVSCVVILILGRKDGSYLRSWRPLAWAIIILALIEPLIITQSLKHLWGRVRFRNLGPGAAGFTPFFLPAGPGAGESFPSGHAAMAFVMTPIVFFLSRVGTRLVTWAALSVVLTYGFLVSWGRIIAGAHYLTDCLFSAGASFLLSAIIVRQILRRVETQQLI